MFWRSIVLLNTNFNIDGAVIFESDAEGQNTIYIHFKTTSIQPPYEIHDLFLPVSQGFKVVFILNIIGTSFHNFSNLLLNKNESADLVIKVGNINIYAHKLILVCRSAYFKSMFESNHFLESSEKVIDVPSCYSYESLVHALKYIYSCEFDNNLDYNQLLKLLEVARYYLLDDLVLICETNLALHLQIENCIKTFVLSDNLDLKYLKKKSKLFIYRHKNNVVETADYKSMVNSRSDLLSELFMSANLCQH